MSNRRDAFGTPRSEASRLGPIIQRYGPASPEANAQRSRLAAAKVDRAITDALAASGGPLIPEDAAQLAARLQGGARS